MRGADHESRRLLDHLAAAGPSNIEDLQVELELGAKELKTLRTPLERCGAIVSRSLQVTAGDSHAHSSELARWDQVFSGTGDGCIHLHHSLQKLLLASVQAAVLAPEVELERWFTWRWYWDAALVDDLIRTGRLRRVDGYVCAAEP